MVLYGIAGTLFAYCVSLFVASPLAAFAATAGYQIIMYIVRDSLQPPQIATNIPLTVVSCIIPARSHVCKDIGRE